MGKKKRKLGAYYLLSFLAIAVLAFAELPQLFTEDLTFRAFDVGQGDSFLFSFPDGSNMLVDAGPRKTRKELVSKLRGLGVRSIDILVATHPHEDHIGGIPEVIRSFPIGKVWDSGYVHGSNLQKEMLELIRKKQIRFGKPRAGFTEERGGARIEVLAPARLISGTASDANNNGLILRVSYGEISFLLMADVEEPGRARIAAFPRSTILKASHHGSRNGTDDELLRQTEPEVVILSYGKGNSYGHPHKETRGRLSRARIKSYATADGDIEIVTDGEVYSVKQ